MQTLLRFLFGLLILAPVAGELFRIPVGPLELLPADLIIPAIFIAWVIHKVRSDRHWRWGKVGKMAMLFLFVVTLSYSLNLLRFDPEQMLSAFPALGRLGMYVVLAPMAYDLLHNDSSGRFRKMLLACMLLAMLLIALLGFAQLHFFPSFLELGLYLDGWDPHIGRLLSTWFDPNFVAGYLAFMLPVALALALYFWRIRRYWLFALLAFLALIALVALYLTFSRSGYLAFLAALGLLSLLKSPRLLAAGLLAFALAFSASPRMQQRSLEAVDSAKSLIGLDSQKPLDPTARFRVESWQIAGEIIAEHPLLGIGYNRYAHEINRRGYGELSGHASSGSDSSLLTIWATTGLFGLLSYLAMAFVAAALAFRRAWTASDLPSTRSAGLLAGFGGLFVHSFFVNSLLYALIMTTFWVGLALLDEI